MTTPQPFRIEIPQADIDDLKVRLARTLFGPATVRDRLETGAFQGPTPGACRVLGDLVRLAERGGTAQCAAAVHPDNHGQRIHFVHARSPEPDALPLIHFARLSRPFVEFADISVRSPIRALTAAIRPTPSHVVRPSLPGFGFSTPVTETGWPSVAPRKPMFELMRRLGYARYGAQGGESGAGVAGSLAAGRSDAGGRCSRQRRPDGHHVALDNVADRSTKLDESDRAAVDAVRKQAAEGKGYLQLQSTRPQTIAYSLTTRPPASSPGSPRIRGLDGPRQDASRSGDRTGTLAQQCQLYWSPQSGASAAQFLYERTLRTSYGERRRPVPQGWALFAAESFVRPHSRSRGADRAWSESRRAATLRP